MEKICVDITQINEISNDILLLTNEIKEIFDDTFSAIVNLTSQSGMWQGNSADIFKNDTLFDKTQYDDFRNNLNRFSNYLKNYSTELNDNTWRLKR